MRDLYQTSMELWQSHKNGQKEAFEQLFHTCYDPLFRFGLSLQAPQELVRDAIQESFFKLWQQAQGDKEIKAIWPYLIRVLRNRIIDDMQKELKNKELVTTSERPKHQISKEEEILIRETEQANREQLQTQLAELPTKLSEAIYWRYYEGLEYEEIAAYMGVSQQVAYNYVNRGIKRLRENVQNKNS